MPLPKAGSNSLFSNSFFIFIIRFFPSLASLLVMLWYSRHLPQDVYGGYQNFWIQLYVIYPLICFGIHVLIITYSRDFIAGLLARLRPRHVALYGLWFAGLSLAFALLQQWQSGFPIFIPFLFIASFSSAVIIESVLIVYRRYAALAAISLAYSAAFAYLHWHVLNSGFSLSTLFTGLVILSLARLTVYLLVAIPEFRKTATTITHQPADLKAIRSLWLHLGAYDVLQILFSYIDKFIISLVLSASVSAIYYNGSQNIPFLPLMLSAAGSAVLIQLASGSAKDEQGNIISLMNQSGRILSCVVFPVFFFLLLFRVELITTLLSAKYVAAIPVFAAALLALPVKAYSFTTVLQRMHKGAIINIGAVADLVLACGLMYPMYYWLGLPGVALSFVITTYLQAAFYLVYSAQLLGVSVTQLVPMVNWLVKLIVFACMFIAIHYLGSVYLSKNISLILGGAVMAISIAVALYIEVSKQRKHVGIP